MTDQTKSYRQRLKENFLHILFILDNQRITNKYATALSDILQLSSLMFYFLNPNLEYQGPLLSIYTKNIEPYVILYYDSKGQPWIPVTILAWNLLFIVLIGFFIQRVLQSFLVTLAEIYLYLIPILFIDQVIAIYNIRFLNGVPLIISATTAPATFLILFFGMFLHKKQYRFYEIVLIAAIKFGGGKWIILGLLIFKSALEYFLLGPQRTPIKSFQVAINIFLTISHIMTLASNSKCLANDIFLFVGIASIIIASILINFQPQSNLLSNIGTPNAKFEESSKDMFNDIQSHFFQCTTPECQCSKIANIDSKNLEQITELAYQIKMLEISKRLKKSKDYFALAQFCINYFNSNLKGLSLMVSNVKPKNIFQEYRYMSICLKYEIVAKSQRSTGKSFQIKPNEVRNIEEQISKFRQRILQLAKYLYAFWERLKAGSNQQNYVESIVEVSKKINKIEKEYKRLSHNYDESKQLQILYKIFRQRITRQQTQNTNQKIIVPQIPPFLLSRNFNIVKLNQQFSEMFGWHNQQLIGQRIEKIIPQCFHPFHSDWVNQYIECYDIKVASVKEGMKFVKCKEGVIKVITSKLHILPRFEDGIEILNFFFSQDFQTDADVKTGYLLADLTTNKILDFDLNLLRILKIEAASGRYNDILKEVELSELIPSLLDGQERLLEDMKLSPSDSSLVSFKLKPILDIMMVKCKAQFMEPLLQVSFLNFSQRIEVQNLRLMKCRKEICNSSKNSTTVHTKAVCQHSNFLQDSLKKQQQLFTTPYILLIGPFAIFLLHIFSIFDSEQLTLFIESGYAFLQKYLSQSLNIVRKAFLKLQTIGDSNLNQLYQFWLKFGFGDPNLFSSISSILRGDISDNITSSFSKQVARNPMSIQLLIIQKEIEQKLQLNNLLQLACLVFLCAYMFFTIIDLVYNIRYILKINIKIRQTISIIKMIDLTSINKILLDLFEFQQAFRKNQLEQQSKESESYIQNQYQQINTIALRSEVENVDDSTQVLKKRKRSSRASIETMSVLFHAQNISYEARMSNRISIGCLRGRPSQLSKAANVATSFDSPTPLNFLHQMIDSPKSPSPSQQLVEIMSMSNDLQGEQILKDYSKTSLSIFLIVLSTLLFLALLTCEFVVFYRMAYLLKNTSAAQNVINQQFSTLQKQTLFTYLQLQTQTFKNLDLMVNKQKQVIGKIQGQFDKTQLIWSQSNTGNLCQYSTNNRDQCQQIQNGVFQMGQFIVFGNFAQNARRIQISPSIIDTVQPYVQNIESILKYQATFCSILTQTLKNEILSYLSQCRKISYILFTTSIVWTIMFLFFTHKILSIYCQKGNQTKKLLQIIPGQILSSNQRIQKRLAGQH